MKIRLSDIKTKAASRPPGYFEDVLSHGMVMDGVLKIDAKAYNALLRKYNAQTAVNPPTPKAKCCKSPKPPSLPPKPLQMPPLRTQLTNMASAVVRSVKAVVTGHQVKADEATVAARKAICEGCEKMDTKTNRCSLCGCRLHWKQQMQQESCPISLW